MNKEYAIGRALDGLGALNAMLKKMMEQTGEEDPKEAIRQFNAGEWLLSEAVETIDCNADPFLPGNMLIEEHRRDGIIKWIRRKQEDSLFLSRSQVGGIKITGHVLRQELINEPVQNACVADYLLENRQFIPRGWKGKSVFFWGTIFRRKDNGRLSVRYITDGNGTWSGYYLPLNCGFGETDLAALYK